LPQSPELPRYIQSRYPLPGELDAKKNAGTHVDSVDFAGSVAGCEYRSRSAVTRDRIAALTGATPWRPSTLPTIESCRSGLGTTTLATEQYAEPTSGFDCPPIRDLRDPKTGSGRMFLGLQCVESGEVRSQRRTNRRGLLLAPHPLRQTRHAGRRRTRSLDGSAWKGMVYALNTALEPEYLVGHINSHEFLQEPDLELENGRRRGVVFLTWYTRGCSRVPY
jgi:hypothetical protein